MARLTYVLKKLEKAGFTVSQSEGRPRTYYAHKAAAGRGETVTFHAREDGTVGDSFYCKADHMQDDIQTDYFAGTFRDNVTQAIAWVDWSLGRYETQLAEHEAGTCHRWCGYCREEHEAGQCVGACDFCRLTAEHIAQVIRGERVS